MGEDTRDPKDSQDPEDTRDAEAVRVRRLILGVISAVIFFALFIVFTMPPLDEYADDRTWVTATVSPDKRSFFEDPAVEETLGKHGYRVLAMPHGSWESVRRTRDLVFPASELAAEKIMQDEPEYRAHEAFHSPMAIATFEPIVRLLEAEGAATRVDGMWRIDVAKLMEMQAKGVRWRDLGDGSFPSPRTVQVATADLPSDNSAVMYLGLASWVANDGRVVSSEAEADAVSAQVAPLFRDQGYKHWSSAGLFRDYLDRGMGAAPMVMINESQFLEEAVRPGGRIRDGMVLAYPSPTTLTTHVAIGTSEKGKEVARLLAEDPRLRELAAQHGFRTGDGRVVPAVAEALPPGIEPPETFIDSVGMPAADLLDTFASSVRDSSEEIPSTEYSEPQWSQHPVPGGEEGTR